MSKGILAFSAVMSKSDCIIITEVIKIDSWTPDIESEP